uniref:Uncharacterized protein n=1 Tax=Anguilla anguilla TaxID=7936 RepID=A0A0E9XP53_ANGAN
MLPYNFLRGILKRHLKMKKSKFRFTIHLLVNVQIHSPVSCIDCQSVY